MKDVIKIFLVEFKARGGQREGMYICPTRQENDDDDDDKETATPTMAFTSDHIYEKKVIAY